MNSFEMRVSSQDVNKKVEDDSIPDVDKLKDNTDSSETNTTDHELYTSTRKVTLSDITSEDFSTSCDSHTEDNSIIDKNMKKEETYDLASFSDTSNDDTNMISDRKVIEFHREEEFQREETYDTSSFNDTSTDKSNMITDRKVIGLQNVEDFHRKETYDTASFSDNSTDDSNMITNREEIGRNNVEDFEGRETYYKDSSIDNNVASDMITDRKAIGLQNEEDFQREETYDTASFSGTSKVDSNMISDTKVIGLHREEEFQRKETYDTALFSDNSIDNTNKITNRKDSGLHRKEEFQREAYDTASFSDNSIDDTNKITNRKAIGLLNEDDFQRGEAKQKYNTDINLVCCISDMMKTLEDLSVKVDSLQQLKTDTQIIKEEIVEVMFEKDSALTEIKNNARNIIKRKDQQIQKLKNRSAENELDSVSIAAFKLEKSKQNLALKDEIEELKNKNRALSGMVAHIPILENKLKEAEEKHEVKLQFLKQHYEHKITDINNNYLINNDEFKAKMGLQDTLNQQLENELHSIKSESNDKGQLDEKYNFMKVRIEGLENQVKQLRKVNDNVTKDKNYHLMKFGRELNDQKEHLKEELLLKENLGKLLKSSDEENLQLKEQLLKLCDDNTLKDKIIIKQEGEIKGMQEELQRYKRE